MEFFYFSTTNKKEINVPQEKSMEEKNIIAQWAFDTRPILGRFHLWLEDVKVQWLRGEPEEGFRENISFVGERMECLLVVMTAATALGTRLFGRYAEGVELNKKEINQVKKEADAISAYVMSESLWYLSRSLPENHAIMVSLGEGLMPKVGETPEMGSNPQLGFGRVYARPQVAQFLDDKIQKLLNEKNYRWENFYRDINKANITVWGAAIDTLENTSRFAQGKKTGPLTIFHLFDQPLSVTKPYEGYMGNLALPQAVMQKAEEKSILINFYTPRDKVLEVIEETYPAIRRENIHVWTLRGKSRAIRLQKLWDEWESLGVHILDDGWKLPGGGEVFTDSGTYMPNFAIKTWEQEGQEHLLICDGYSASAEAMQAASLSPLLDIHTSLAIFSSRFEESYDQEARIMQLDPESKSFAEDLSQIFQRKLSSEDVYNYQECIHDAREAGIPLDKRNIVADDFFPEKKWRVMALTGYMLDDPYTSIEGVKDIGDSTYEVNVRLATRRGDKIITLALRREPGASGESIFNPLLTRFMAGEDYQNRPVKISDSGRIRNELQTLCSESLEHFDNNGIRVLFKDIPADVIPLDKQKILKEILAWYRKNHPTWFSWLDYE